MARRRTFCDRLQECAGYPRLCSDSLQSNPRYTGWSPPQPLTLTEDPQYERDRADFFEGHLGKLFAELRHGIWHTTGPSGYLGIRESGAIEPSTGKRPFTFPQTKNSFALKNGLVSVFDLGSAAEEECVFMSWKWTKFFSHFRPFTVAMELDRATLSATLVPHSACKGSEGENSVWIPWVEAWHRGPVPLLAIKRYLVLPYGRLDSERWLTPSDREHTTLEAWARESLTAV